MIGSEHLQLSLVDRFNIKNKPASLDEPSGLALSLDRRALWTVSDDTKKVFKLDLQGQVIRSFKIPKRGLEGITLDPTRKLLFAVREKKNEVLKIKIDTGKTEERKSLEDMENYESIAPYFTDNSESIEENKGLEGIAWNEATGTIFVLKEGFPGLLIEISADLKTIKNHKLLNKGIDSDRDNKTIDFSGICYDESRDSFWIVSDQARRLFLYDLSLNMIVRSISLSYARHGKKKRIKKAEGVAFDPDLSRLYVVSDRKKRPRLYVLEMRSQKHRFPKKA